jgi:PKHD-type hydroxylase
MRELFHLIPNAFDDDEIASLISKAEQNPAQDGTVFSTAKGAETIRKSTIRWLRDEALQNRLWGYVQAANQAGFGVDVTNQADIQFTTYEASNSGHYDWHHDVHWSGQDSQDRKISLTIQLTDPDDYEGGAFEFEEVKTSADFTPKGTVLLFPSYLRHKVHPVTAGTRKSLVAWFFGKRWQ